MTETSRTKRVIISLPAELLDELDVYVARNKYNRSECIRHAIRQILSHDVQPMVQPTA